MTTVRPTRDESINHQGIQSTVFGAQQLAEVWPSLWFARKLKEKTGDCRRMMGDRHSWKEVGTPAAKEAFSGSKAMSQGS